MTYNNHSNIFHSQKPPQIIKEIELNPETTQPCLAKKKEFIRILKINPVRNRLPKATVMVDNTGISNGVKI